MNESHGDFEREQRYFVLNKSKRTMLVRTLSGEITDSDSFFIEDLMGSEVDSHSLTEAEIRGYDEGYWSFAVKVNRGTYYIIEDDLGYNLSEIPLSEESRRFNPVFENDLELALKMNNLEDAKSIRNISGGTIVEMRD